MTYRLLAGAEADIDRILLRSASDWGVSAAERYHRLILAACEVVGDDPDAPGARNVERVTGVRVYPLRLARRLLAPGQRVVRPRHLVVYRIANDGVVEIMGLAHDRMLLSQAARRMRRGAGS